MIDLHSHILPGIDDGATTLDDALDIARNSVSVGVTHMMCTPHIHQGVFDNDATTIRQAFNQLTSAITANSIPLKLGIACEMRLNPEILQLHAKQELLFLGEWEGKSALLLELPHSHIPAGVENLIRWLLKNNVQPIIPHPERNRDIMADYSKIHFLKRLGCIFQITAGVFVERFSPKSVDVANRMLADGLISYVASDTHSVQRRPNDMKDCFEYLSMQIGVDKALDLVLNTPRKITTNITWM